MRFINHLRVFRGVYRVVIFDAVGQNEFALEPKGTAVDETVLVSGLGLQLSLSDLGFLYLIMKLVVLVVQGVVFQS